MASVSGVIASRHPRPPVNVEKPALFLDLDGVLAPLASTPDEVSPDSRRTDILRRVTVRLMSRVAVISGRTLSEIDRITEGAAPAASGVHGLERRRLNGSMVARTADPAVLQAIKAFDAFAADNPGVIVEDKRLSAGLHYRQAPQVSGSALDLAQSLANETGLDLQRGAMVLELKTPGADKGMALTEFMAEEPFHGALPIMVGDDLTDEYGFEAAGRLGGFGILVGPERQTAARYRLDDVEDVLVWLDSLGRGFV